MLSTMQDLPLTVSRILEHGMRVHAGSQVTTWTGGPEPERRSFGEVGERAIRLANALRDELGVDGDQRVATLMCDSASKTLPV